MTNESESFFFCGDFENNFFSQSRVVLEIIDFKKVNEVLVSKPVDLYFIFTLVLNQSRKNKIRVYGI